MKSWILKFKFFQNALEFNDVKAREVMIPRTEILAVDISESVANIKKLFIETGYSKIIVYKNSLDEIVGYVHAFDMFKKTKKFALYFNARGIYSREYDDQ